MRGVWFRFWMRWYGRHLCDECYPPEDGRRRACQRWEPEIPVIETSAKTGETRRFIRPAQGCTHRHHSYEVWFA